MSYLLDKKTKRKKILVVVGVFICLLTIVYFRSGIFYNLSYVSHLVFRPVLVLGNSVGDKFINAKAYFISKKALYLENQNLQSKLSQNENKMSNYDSILDENINLKDILGRSLVQVEKKEIILATILSKSNRSLYDTLTIDIGSSEGIEGGDIVFALGRSSTGDALGDIPIGRISEVYQNSSKVILFSSASEKTQAVLSGKNIFLEIIGRGGGNFEMIIPQDLELLKGDQVVLPGIIPRVLATVETIISDPREPTVKALLVSPVNTNELKFVQVKSKNNVL